MSGPAIYGVSYRGAADLLRAAEAVVRHLERLGLLCEVGLSDRGNIWIEGRSRFGWVRMLGARLPQRLRGSVERVGLGREIRISLDPRLTASVRRAILLAWAGWVIALGIAMRLTDGIRASGREPSPGPVLLGLAAVAVAALLPYFLRPVVFGGGQVALWHPILDRVEARGDRLEPETTGIGRRGVLWSLGYGLSFALFGGGGLLLAVLERASRISPLAVGMLTGLIGLALFLFAIAGLIAYWRGLGLRTEAVVTGLGSSAVAMLFLMTPLLPWLASWPTIAAMEPSPDQLTAWSRTIIVAIGGTTAVALGFGAYLIRMCQTFPTSLQRLRRRQDRAGIYRDAVRGGPLLTGTRICFLTYAAVAGALLVAGLSVAACWAVQAWVPVFAGPEVLRLPETTGPMLAAALGRPLDDLLAYVVAATIWTVWALAIWLAWSISLVELAVRRRKTARELAEWSAVESRRHRRAQELLDGLTRRADVQPVRLAILPERGVRSYAYRVYLPRPQRVIAVASGALTHLRPHDLEALLAHELAHLELGHVARQDFARWLGRAALLGDGFVRGLLDSYGWERDADEAAVRRFGADRDGLVRCIRITAGAPPSRSEREASVTRAAGRSAAGSWSVGWNAFRRQYFGWSPLRSWHPAKDERIGWLRSRIEPPIARGGVPS